MKPLIEFCLNLLPRSKIPTESPSHSHAPPPPLLVTQHNVAPVPLRCSFSNWLKWAIIQQRFPKQASLWSEFPTNIILHRRRLGNLTRQELVRFPNLLYVSRRIWLDKNMQLSNLIDTISLKQLGNLLTLMSSWVEDLKPFNVYHTTFPSMPVDATVFWQLYGKYKVSSFDRGR